MPYFQKNINMAKIMSMTANAEKDFIEKMEQQHFKERWQEAIGNKIQLDEKHPRMFFRSSKAYSCTAAMSAGMIAIRFTKT